MLSWVQANLASNMLQCVLLVGVLYLIWHQHQRQRAAMKTAADVAAQLTTVLTLMRQVSERQLQTMERGSGVSTPPAAPAAPPPVDVFPPSDPPVP